MGSNKSIFKLIVSSILVSTISNGFVSGMDQRSSIQGPYYGIPTQRKFSSKTSWSTRPIIPGYVQQPCK